MVLDGIWILISDSTIKDFRNLTFFSFYTSSIQKRPSQSDRSGVSLKSDQSRNPDVNFKERHSFAEKRSVSPFNTSNKLLTGLHPTKCDEYLN